MPRLTGGVCRRTACGCRDCLDALDAQFARLVEPIRIEMYERASWVRPTTITELIAREAVAGRINDYSAYPRASEVMDDEG